MTANLTTNNSVYLYKEPAWHKMGFVSQNKMGAVEAMAKIDSFWYEKRQPQVLLNGKMQAYGDYVIVRSPVPGKPDEAVLGTVKDNYNILQPIEIAEEFDLNVCQPVETFGFLGNDAEKVFLTWKLPSITVKEDKIDLFGFVASGYDGKFGASLYIVSIRVVCSNTFTMAIRQGENSTSTDGTGKTWSGKHNSHNLKRDLGIWMEHVQARAIEKSNLASESFNIMAGKAIRDNKELTNLLLKIYPNPNPLPLDYPLKLRDEKQASIDEKTDKALNDRSMVESLFNGQGIQCNDGNGWSLFCACTEYENHHRMIKKPVDYSILFGNRADTMTHAYNVINNWIVA